LYHLKNFNSTLVWLILQVCKNDKIIGTFQFHIGMINPQIESMIIVSYLNHFNSTLVWLIPFTKLSNPSTLPNFNSTLVWLILVDSIYRIIYKMYFNSTLVWLIPWHMHGFLMGLPNFNSTLVWLIRNLRFLEDHWQTVISIPHWYD